MAQYPGSDTWGGPEQRAARGAEALDKALPGWANCTRPDELRMDDPNQCILGQVFGYLPGLKVLDLEMQVGAQRRLGFEFPYEGLKEAWLAEIAKRITS